MPITSIAQVATDRPERYAKQLVSHLGRKVAWVTENGTSTATLGTASASVATADGLLVLTATAMSPAEVERIENALASHLHRFATRDTVEVTWKRERTARIP